MQLNDILEESDVKKISQKTNISKENIEILMDEDFTQLTKAKALGFISILERDYKVELKMLREKALSYYEKHGNEEERMVFSLPESEEDTDRDTGSSKWFWGILLGLIAYALWYFGSQFDGDINEVIPFIKETLGLAVNNDMNASNVLIENVSE